MEDNKEPDGNPTKEVLKTQEITFLFDVDGVLTNPDTKVANEEVLRILAARINNGDSLSLVTGRAYAWLEKNLFPQLIGLIQDKSKLDNLFISAEHGMVHATFENGISNLEIGEDLIVPHEIRDRIKEVAEKVGQGVFYDLDKYTMSSVEITGGEDQERVRKEKAALDEVESALREELESRPDLKIQRTEIAVDVMNKNVGKDVAARNYLEFLRKRGIKVNQFIVFGDSPTDTQASDWLHDNNENVKFYFVGKKELPNKEYPVVRSSGDYFDQATLGFLKNDFFN